MRILRLLLIVLFALFEGRAFASGGVTCSNWISRTGATASSMGGDLGSAIQLGTDASTNTVSQACRDALDADRYIKGFPTIFTRYKLVRSGDAFNPIYRVHSQACKYRDAICGELECSYSDVSIRTTATPPYVSVSCGSKTDQWIDEKTYDPDSSKVSNLCLEIYAPGEEIKHFINTTNTADLKMVCAYVSPKNSYGNCLMATTGTLIGCVDQLPKPAPPIYNPVIVTLANPMVNTFGFDADTNPTYNADVVGRYIAVGSRFDAPIIQLQISNPNLSYTPTLTLQASFPNYTSGTAVYDSNSVSSAYSRNSPVMPNPAPTNGVIYPSSGSFPNSVYKPSASGVYTFYAKIPSSDPSQVCACMKISIDGSVQDLCASESYLGCVPRPTLLQSGYIMVVDNISGIYNDGKYPDYTDTDGTDVSNNNATPIPNAQITFVKTDASGLPVIFDRDGARIAKKLQDRKYYKLDNSNQLTSILASYPWSTLDDYYSGAYPVVTPSDAATSAALTARKKKYNTNFLPQPPVALLDSDGNPVVIKSNSTVSTTSSVFEYRPVYDIVATGSTVYPLKVSGYSRDVISIYGVNFSAIIPQMSSITYKPLQVNLLTPSARQNIDYCNAYSSGFSLSSSYIGQLNLTNSITSYYVPDGTRWRGACRGKPGCYAGTPINGSSQDCSQASSAITGTNVRAGNYFLCDTDNTNPNNFSTNCCLGAIANNFNFITPSVNNACPFVTGACSGVIAHDSYAEAIACPGVYTTEVGPIYEAAQNNYNPYYQRPLPSQLTMMANSSMISSTGSTSFPTTASGSSFPTAAAAQSATIDINGVPTDISFPGPIPTVTKDATSSAEAVLNALGSNYAVGNLPVTDPATGVAPKIDPATGIIQAANICIYSPDSMASSTGTWNPIGYSLNSPDDGTSDPSGFNAYLCDHILQMCNTITSSYANTNTGYATWPRTLSTASRASVSASGTCVLGYSTSDGKNPTATCNDGWLMTNAKYEQLSDSNTMSVENSCLSNCQANYTQANFTIASNSVNYNNPTTIFSGKTTTKMSNGITVAVANGAVSGVCNTGYHNSSAGTSVSATCANGTISPSVSSLCQADCAAATSSYSNFPGGSNGATGTATSCAANYGFATVNGVAVAPTATCSNGSWTNLKNDCVYTPLQCPATTYNGAVFAAGTPGVTVTGSCDNTNGYYSSTNPTAPCKSDGTWDWANLSNSCGNQSCAVIRCFVNGEGNVVCSSSIDGVTPYWNFAAANSGATKTGTYYTNSCTPKSTPQAICQNGSWKLSSGKIGNQCLKQCCNSCSSNFPMCQSRTIECSAECPMFVYNRSCNKSCD